LTCLDDGARIYHLSSGGTVTTAVIEQAPNKKNRWKAFGFVASTFSDLRSFD